MSKGLEDLFKVQAERGDHEDINMDDLSRAFGLLLHSTGAMAQLTSRTATKEICSQIVRMSVRAFYLTVGCLFM